MEINQQADGKIQQPEMRKQLSLIDWMQRFFTFQLKRNPTFYNQISAKSAIEFYAVINHGNRFLSFYSQSDFREFIGQTCLVSRF